ncbi:hypothetical protein BDQ12DRAFT_674641 [Crucibulum laeve]|uniref:Uncharacterized protein n=1 Tax=Crucibulum laeve TaxID=68775 RepID=A0A5C3MEY5_9AGAR|nr:hypothetical protein BDQ12DRAFT_674641 [Crucibulum laeve]
MLLARQHLCRPPILRFTRYTCNRTLSGLTSSTDSCGIPHRPTWSVYELLSSYPKPTIPPATFKRLYELSALVPPEEGTPEHAKITGELEEMVKLVEAVKLVDTDGVSIRGRGEAEDADRWCYTEGFGVDGSSEQGQALLKHAARTVDGFYVVDADRKR